MTEMRCWYCGAVGTVMGEIQTFESATPVVILVQWPSPADHDHTDVPPTPDQLEEFGREVLQRIRTALLG